jgi:hypothetical protein
MYSSSVHSDSSANQDQNVWLMKLAEFYGTKWMLLEDIQMVDFWLFSGQEKDYGVPRTYEVGGTLL